MVVSVEEVDLNTEKNCNISTDGSESVEKCSKSETTIEGTDDSSRLNVNGTNLRDVSNSEELSLVTLHVDTEELDKAESNIRNNETDQPALIPLLTSSSGNVNTLIEKDGEKFDDTDIVPPIQQTESESNKKYDTVSMDVDEPLTEESISEPTCKLGSKLEEKDEIKVVEETKTKLDYGNLEETTSMYTDEVEITNNSISIQEKIAENSLEQINERKSQLCVSETKTNNLVKVDLHSEITEPVQNKEVTSDSKCDTIAELAQGNKTDDRAQNIGDIKKTTVVISIQEQKCTDIEKSRIISSPVNNDVTTSEISCTATTNASIAAPVDSASESGSRIKRSARALHELETDRDGRISSSSSNGGISSGSEAENNEDCKRIRFDESIFEEDERERLIREFVERSSESIEEIGKNYEKLQHEIMALSDLARAKELEWNSIMRLLKLKEEMLERISFKKRHLTNQNKSEIDLNVNKLLKNITSSNYCLPEQSKVNRSEPTKPVSNTSSHVVVAPVSSTIIPSSGISSSSSTPNDLFKNSNVSIAAVDSTNKLRLQRPILPKTVKTPFYTAATCTPLSTSSYHPTPPSIQSAKGTHSVTAQPHTITSPVTHGLLQQTSMPMMDKNSVIGEMRQPPTIDPKSDFRAKTQDSQLRQPRRRNPQFGTRAQEVNLNPRFSGSNNALSSLVNMALGSGSYIRTNISSSTHNDHRPGNLYFGQDSPMSTTLNRPDLQIRPANIESLMLSINNANTSNSSQPSSNMSNNSGALLSSGTNNAMISAVNNSNNSGGMMNNSNLQEALFKFAKMNEKSDLTSKVSVGMHVPGIKNAHVSPPPPYPEVTLHPVMVSQFPGSATSQNSLLHGILTKSNSVVGSGNSNRDRSNSPAGIANNVLSSPILGNVQHRSTTFSPTLARLLTAPERNRANRVAGSGISNRNPKATFNELSITKKPRTEVTITPVTSTSNSSKSLSDVLMVDDDDENENSDRLVIDEGRDTSLDASSNVIPADQVPECQGCHKKSAQFVCAGCGNQWYCSRECQVQAWEEHSEMCSG